MKQSRCQFISLAFFSFLSIYLYFFIMENLDRFSLRVLFQNWEHYCCHAALPFKEIIACTFSHFFCSFFFPFLSISSLSCNVSFIAMHFLSMWLVCFVGVSTGFGLRVLCYGSDKLRCALSVCAMWLWVWLWWLTLCWVLWCVFLGFWEMELRSWESKEQKEKSIESGEEFFALKNEMNPLFDQNPLFKACKSFIL